MISIVSSEFVPLGDLQRLAGDLSKDLGFPLVLRFLKDVATGLSVMHDLRYLHRDLKSPNVMLASLDHSADVCCKIIDFGSAARVDKESVRSRSPLITLRSWLIFFTLVGLGARSYRRQPHLACPRDPTESRLREAERCVRARYDSLGTRRALAAL